MALAKYAAFGVAPLVIPSMLEDVPIPIDQIPRHQGTDYAYIKQLAHEVGYVFYIDPGPAPGISMAYWGPEIRSARRSRRSTIDMDARTTTSERSPSPSTRSARRCPIVYIQEPVSKAPIPIPIPDITPLNPPLGVVPPLPPKLDVPRRTPRI